MTIRFYNSLTRHKEDFVPADPHRVSLYVCGPTVYQRPHIGNARSVVIYDLLFRLLRETYGEDNVMYARNITDVDDKINAAAKERGISIQALTQEVTADFHTDMDALGCLPPTIEPRATEHLPQIIALIRELIRNENAYIAEGHVLFDVSTDPAYGKLSRRSADDMLAGARVEVAPYKKNPGDFVLWKPAAENDDESSRFDSPWSIGRPGWHIECSAMATHHLGEDFDLHGGGADLMFPHHENEIAQSCCAKPGSQFAKTWVHNGFLTVNGEKMSKSLGNFITVRELLDRGDELGEPSVVRWALLSVHYRKPLDWTTDLLDACRFDLRRFAREIDGYELSLKTTIDDEAWRSHDEAQALVHAFLDGLGDDLNVSVAKSVMFKTTGKVNAPEEKDGFAYRSALKYMCGFIGLDTKAFFDRVMKADMETTLSALGPDDDSEKNGIRLRIEQRGAAKKEKNWAEADRIRDELKAEGILLMDRPDGTTDWQHG